MTKLNIFFLDMGIQLCFVMMVMALNIKLIAEREVGGGGSAHILRDPVTQSERV